jgi:acid stress-induced BolA-like protein IbaG/YrbA
MEFEQRVTKLIKDHYQSAEVHIDFVYGAKKLNGYMVWPGFEGTDMLERQTALYSYLREALGPDAQKISIIFTYTPDEFALMNAA